LAQFLAGILEGLSQIDTLELIKICENAKTMGIVQFGKVSTNLGSDFGVVLNNNDICHSSL
jgi:hypothetical protein